MQTDRFWLPRLERLGLTRLKECQADREGDDHEQHERGDHREANGPDKARIDRRDRNLSLVPVRGRGRGILSTLDRPDDMVDPAPWLRQNLDR